MVLEKTFKSPLDSKEIKPINLEINPEYSLEGLMLKLKHQSFSHQTYWERLKAEEGSDRR